MMEDAGTKPDTRADRGPFPYPCGRTDDGSDALHGGNLDTVAGSDTIDQVLLLIVASRGGPPLATLICAV